MKEGKNAYCYLQIDLSKSEKYVALKLQEIHTKTNMRLSASVRTCVCVVFFFTTDTGTLVAQGVDVCSVSEESQQASPDTLQQRRMSVILPLSWATTIKNKDSRTLRERESSREHFVALLF